MTLHLEAALARQRAALAARFGALPHVHHDLPADSGFFEDMAQAVKRERMGEVILLLRRSGDQVLLHTKTFYPQDVYRLPSGGIQGDEPVMAAAARETAEETGLSIQQNWPLGSIGYTFWNGDARIDFHSWLVLADVEGEAHLCDPNERIEGYRWVEIAALGRVAAQLRAVPETWGSWGNFRAVAHDLAATWISRNSTYA
ncbi:MAG: NUDIX hydrolase [Anaerolineae bacterium]|nr:NUDIX hydrolase [Anaerolineae bacterium]